MNTSPVLLLLIFLLSACHGEGQMDSKAANISATAREQKEIGTPLADLCPDPADIEPCVCTNGSKLYMECVDIEDEQQLWNIFSAHFPTTAFYQLYLYNARALKVLENGVFHNVSFQWIEIWSHSVEVVEDEALNPSLSTLTKLSFMGCSLTTFPFERLPEFTSLNSLDFSNNPTLSIPPLSSPTLQSLWLLFNPTSYFPRDYFKGLPAIQELYLPGCQLTEIIPETFKDLPELNSIYLLENRLSYLQNLTFDIVSSPDHPGYLDLGNNNISLVEEGAFQGVQEFSKILMYFNFITELPERVWRPVLEKGITVDLLGNPLKCGCDVAWLVRNPDLAMMTEEAQCPFGQLIPNLDPDDFTMCD